MDKDTSKATCNIGSRIRYQRKLHNMSQEKLALAASMNPAFIGHLERGEKSPTHWISAWVICFPIPWNRTVQMSVLCIMSELN